MPESYDLGRRTAQDMSENPVPAGPASSATASQQLATKPENPLDSSRSGASGAVGAPVAPSRASSAAYIPPRLVVLQPGPQPSQPTPSRVEAVQPVHTPSPSVAPVPPADVQAVPPADVQAVPPADVQATQPAGVPPITLADVQATQPADVRADRGEAPAAGSVQTEGAQLDRDMPDILNPGPSEPEKTLLRAEPARAPYSILPERVVPAAVGSGPDLSGPVAPDPQPVQTQPEVQPVLPQPVQMSPEQPPMPAVALGTIPKAATEAATEATAEADGLTPTEAAGEMAAETATSVTTAVAAAAVSDAPPAVVPTAPAAAAPDAPAAPAATATPEMETPTPPPAPAAPASTSLGSIFSAVKTAASGAIASVRPGSQAPASMAAPGEEPAQPGQPQRSLSLFEPVEILRGGMLPEDLPFANEVDAALARRPLRMERYLSLAVGCGVLLFIVWAAFAYIDEVTHAEGQVISSQRTQAIQNLEGGILRNILVSEGQTVEKGVALAQLDNELAASSYRDAINKALDNTLAIIRLEAERKGEVPLFPEKEEEWVQEVVGPQNMVTALPQAHQAIKDQMSAYQARTQQKNAELQLLDSQYQQRMHEVGELTARKRQLDESLALAVEQRDIAAGLLQKRSTSRVDYLNQQQRVVQLSGEVEALASTIPKAQSAAQETAQRMTFRKAEIDAAVTDELNKRRMDLASINETLAAGGDRVTRTELRSPVRGTVKRIAITTLGGVVKPGESIMEIVPLDDTLLVEAKVRPADVAFLRPGQRAMVKVSAYDFSIYGGLEGVLEQISADTIEDKRGEFFYLVKVRTNKTAIQHQDKSLPIIPGMVATVDILIGKKTVLDYLLKPILKARDRALRER